MKRFSIIFAFLALGFLTVSCGGTSGGKNVLHYMRWANPQEEEATREIVEAFEKENPGVKVKMEVLPWGQYWDKLQTMFASGNPPDVFMMSGAMLYDFVNKGNLMDLTSFIEKDTQMQDLLATDFFELPVKTFTVHGRVYGLPRDINTVALYYNKDLFDEKGVAYPDESWTWEEFLDAAKKLTSDENGDGITDSYGFLTRNNMENGWAPFVWTNGGQVLSSDKRKCLLDQAPAVEAIKFLVDLIHFYKVAPTPASAESLGAADPFLSGRIGMNLEGSWMVATYKENAPFSWDVAPIPRSPKARKRKTSANGTANVMSSKTGNPELAWKFIKFFSSPEAQKLLAKSGTSIPVVKSVAYSPVYLDGFPAHKEVFLKALDYAHDLDFTPRWLEWTRAVTQSFDLAWLGQKSAYKACEEAARKVNEILSRAY